MIASVTRSTPEWHRWPPRAIKPAALAPGLALIALLTVVDAWAQPSTAVVGFVIVAPLLTALVSGPREVAAIASCTVAVVVLSPLWRDSFGDSVYVYRVLLVAAAGLLAALLARSRAQVARDRQRFAVLSAVAEIADGTRSLEQTVEGLNDTVVPDVADICIVDAISAGELKRLAVRSAGRDAERITAILSARPPATVAPAGDPHEPRLLARIDEAVLREIATDDEDLVQLRTLGVVSALVVPLRARGRGLGSLTLITTEHSCRCFDAQDLAFVRVLAGRAALALDNAGLFAELETNEAQLTAALSTLAEAVTVQRTAGSLIYANDAAARMLGYDSPQELLATPVEKLVSAFDTTKEDGSPLRLEELPGRRLMAGAREPEPLITRAVSRTYGRGRLARHEGVRGL